MYKINIIRGLNEKTRFHHISWEFNRDFFRVILF